MQEIRSVVQSRKEPVVRQYISIAGVIFCCLVGVALAGAAPEKEASSSCHGPAKASCHGEEAGCHGRSTMLQRRAARQEARIEARQAARAARASCHGEPAPACCEPSCD